MEKKGGGGKGGQVHYKAKVNEKGQITLSSSSYQGELFSAFPKKKKGGEGGEDFP